MCVVVIDERVINRSMFLSQFDDSVVDRLWYEVEVELCTFLFVRVKGIREAGPTRRLNLQGDSRAEE